jgi:hypothetical protein
MKICEMDDELPKFNSKEEELEFYDSLNKLAEHGLMLVEKIKKEKEKLDNNLK